MIVCMWAAPGTRDELRAVLETLAEPTSVEEGFINDELHENLEAQVATPHLVDLVARIPELLDERDLNLDRCRRIA